MGLWESKRFEEISVVKWEYQITRHNLIDFGKEKAEREPTAFFCDQKGQCLLHDASEQGAGRIREALNEEGMAGWELVQFSYHLREILCVWKRALK